MCCGGQTLPALACLGRCHEPCSVTAVAENAARSPSGSRESTSSCWGKLGTGKQGQDRGRELTSSSLNSNVWSSSAEDRALNLSESCRSRASQSPWKGWLVQKGDSCPWPHLDMHCDHLPDISSDVSVAGQGLRSENREGEYFYCGVFQLDQVPEQAAYLHTRDKLPREKRKAP